MSCLFRKELSQKAMLLMSDNKFYHESCQLISLTTQESKWVEFLKVLPQLRKKQQIVVNWRDIVAKVMVSLRHL